MGIVNFYLPKIITGTVFSFDLIMHFPHPIGFFSSKKGDRKEMLTTMKLYDCVVIRKIKIKSQ